LIDAPAFIVAQLLGAFVSTMLFHWLIPQTEGEELIVPHQE
jgi:glycerol uptake facilitator-like aquaporin